jgi:hypothetical protein
MLIEIGHFAMVLALCLAAAQAFFGLAGAHLNRERWLAVVERKSIEDLIGSLSNGTLAFQLAAMAELPLAAVVVEGRYPKLFNVERIKDGWLPDVLARLQIRYREIPIVFADSRKFAEEWAYRFLATAVADLTDGAPSGRDGDSPR